MRDRMGGVRRETGLTLVEVLAAVTVLGVFLTALLALVDGVYTQTAVDAQRRTAGLLAEEAIAHMAQYGADTVISQGTYTRTVNGVQYTVTPARGQAPFRTWQLPGVQRPAEVEAEVTVTWTTRILQRQVQETVTRSQLFPY
ncbi:MAG: prepilin-type N-terminal cleavage/methylation domain-containing protein [Alicyclobacillus macrosporangiidus]|uniref:type IV pilus modification PilV family protein n=1 Tax=Alicyclobacillus macrosporangiidus TaxID=392015 RepID=UPI0026ED60C3|nr:prepilin-type N-terminal cleavage/methylation domain-containing protein [Alicyclobacillus macrosporangiidus]MCL6598571.1 prepilin-type N-terminal cleavage/methylation domain-containing protein [Alicyclobacillus macrosporangiidus]